MAGRVKLRCALGHHDPRAYFETSAGRWVVVCNRCRKRRPDEAAQVPVFQANAVLGSIKADLRRERERRLR